MSNPARTVIMKIKKVVLERPILTYGGKYDKTKVVSPHVIKLHKNYYLMYYVGTSCLPHERKGYKILAAVSKDGLNFVKLDKPILSRQQKDHKYYSPHIVKLDNRFLLYYAEGYSGNYVINVASSNDICKFNTIEENIIPLRASYSAAVHTPRVIYEPQDKNFKLWFTGSNINKKTHSQKYPKYDFGQNFKIFYASSKDGINFSKIRKISFINDPNQTRFINYYGHTVVKYKDYYILIFAGFNGSINCLYLSYSKDGYRFSKPQLLIRPDENKDELGLYSCSLLPLTQNKFRLYYGVRYFSNHWTINSAIFSL